MKAAVAGLRSEQRMMQEHDTARTMAVVEGVLLRASTALPGTTSSSDLATQCGWWSYNDGQGRPHRNAVIDAARAAGMDHAKLMVASTDMSHEVGRLAQRFTEDGVRFFRRSVAPRYDGGEDGPKYFKFPGPSGHTVNHVYRGCPDSTEQAAEWRAATKKVA